MSRFFTHLITAAAAFAALALSSCGNTGSASAPSIGPANNLADSNQMGAALSEQQRDQLSRDRLEKKFAGNWSIENDESGASRIVSDSRTSFDRNKTFHGTRDFAGNRNHNSGRQYNASQWQGARDRQRQAYQGNTRARDGLTRNARVDGQASRYSGQNARTGNYNAGQYGTNSSRFDGRNAGHNQARDRYVERKRGSFDNAPILSNQQSDGSEYTLDEVKRMLGREKSSE